MTQDNNFNNRKGQILLDAMKQSRIKNFVFSNVVLGIDTEGNNFSDFD